eukprot:15150585-Alexandrium_andersonii.AAC.1
MAKKFAKMIYLEVNELDYPSERREILGFKVKVPKKNQEEETPENVKKAKALIHKLHISTGHSKKSSMRMLLERRGCPEWMLKLVDDHSCPDCQECERASGPHKVSLNEAPGIWEVMGTDGFELEEGERKAFCSIYLDVACKKMAVSVFHEGSSKEYFSPKAEEVIEKVNRDWLQHFPKMKYLLLDSHGVYNSE